MDTVEPFKLLGAEINKPWLMIAGMVVVPVCKCFGSVHSGGGAGEGMTNVILGTHLYLPMWFLDRSNGICAIGWMLMALCPVVGTGLEGRESTWDRREMSSIVIATQCATAGHLNARCYGNSDEQWSNRRIPSLKLVWNSERRDQVEPSARTAYT